MAEINHRFVETNGISMHIAEQGEGTLVILCHGFPELWYSWRYQLPALAEAGYRVVAPDQRGYGQTDQPEAIEAYNIMQLVGDMVGLVNALGEDQAIIVGHDTLPGWLSEQDLDFYTKEFERTGFRGGLNWYRNIDRNWELTSFLSGAKLGQPTLFVAGEADGVIKIYRKAFDAMEENVSNLKDNVLLPGAGHWVQQERAAKVNELLTTFLADRADVTAHGTGP